MGFLSRRSVVVKVRFILSAYSKLYILVLFTVNGSVKFMSRLYTSKICTILSA